MSSDPSEYLIIDSNDAWAADPILGWDREIASLTKCQGCGCISTKWNALVDAELQDVPVDPVTATYETRIGTMAVWVWDVLGRWIDRDAIHVGVVYVTESPSPRDKRRDFITFIRHFPLSVPTHGVDASYSSCSTCGQVSTITCERFGYYLRKDVANRHVVLSHRGELIVTARVAKELAEAKAKTSRVKRLKLKPIQVTDSLLPDDTWEAQLPGIPW